jgi:hypothetical protein
VATEEEACTFQPDVNRKSIAIAKKALPSPKYSFTRGCAAALPFRAVAAGPL